MGLATFLSVSLVYNGILRREFNCYYLIRSHWMFLFEHKKAIFYSFIYLTKHSLVRHSLSFSYFFLSYIFLVHIFCYPLSTFVLCVCFTISHHNQHTNLSYYSRSELYTYVNDMAKSVLLYKRQFPSNECFCSFTFA